MVALWAATIWAASMLSISSFGLIPARAAEKVPFSSPWFSSAGALSECNPFAAPDFLAVNAYRSASLFRYFFDFACLQFPTPTDFQGALKPRNQRDRFLHRS